jgi:hypothetical protein
VQAVLPEESQVASSGLGSPLAQAWGATMTTAANPIPLGGFARVLRIQSPGGVEGPKTIMLPTVGGATPPGRSLAAYRAAPIALAYQPPPPLRRIGG